MWILVPRASRSVQESEDWTSPPKWSLELAESVTWRGKLRASSSWLREWRKGGWIRRLFSRMPEPSMADRGVAAWISSLPVTRASRSASQDIASEIETRDTSGRTSGGSSPRFVQFSLFSRTSKGMSREDSSESFETLTNWGSMQNGAFTRRPRPELHISVDDSSCWPTPTASLTNDGESPESFLARQKRWAHKYHNSTPLTIAAKMYGPLDRGGTGQGSPSDSGRRLNPLFVEWLMGFPEGWTDCEPSETRSVQCKRLWLSGISSGGSAKS